MRTKQKTLIKQSNIPFRRCIAVSVLASFVSNALVFVHAGLSVVNAYFDLIVKKINSELGVIEGKLAYAVLHFKNRRMVSRYITDNYKSMKRSSYLSYYQKVTDYIGVCLYGFGKIK